MVSVKVSPGGTREHRSFPHAPLRPPMLAWPVGLPAVRPAHALSPLDEYPRDGRTLR
jgi:hypothetical protein